MTAFIDAHCDLLGVEPICRVLPIAPFIARQAIARHSVERGHTMRAAPSPVTLIERRTGRSEMHGTVGRLMKALDLQGVVRGKKRTTVPDPSQPCPDDKVNREFTAQA